MKLFMSLCFMCLFCSSALAENRTFILTAEQWNIPRSAETILTLAPLAEAMHLLQSGQNQGLQIRYPGGDEGTLWAAELRAWLV